MVRELDGTERIVWLLPLVQRTVLGDLRVLILEDSL